MKIKHINNIAEVRTKLKYLQVLFFFLFFSVTGSFSQINDSLLKYLELAARNNPALLQRFADYRAALEKIPQAGALQDPQLDIGIFLSPMEYVNGNQVADIKLMQMFPWFGVLRNAKDEMSQMANASFEQFRDAKLQVSFDLQKAWYDLYRIRKEIGISQINMKILRIIERLALVQYRSPASGSARGSSGSMPSGNVQQGSSAGQEGGMQGMTGSQAGNPAGSTNSRQQSAPMNGSMESSGGPSRLTDIYRIQIESGDLLNSIALLRSREQSAAALFNSYLDRPASFPVFTPDTLVADTMSISFEAPLDSIANNPMLRMTEFEKKSYEARKKMVTAMGYPMVGVGVNYSLMNMNNSSMTDAAMNGKDMVMPMVSVTIPVYRKKYKAMKREADLQAEAASYSYKTILNSLETEYFQAVELYNDAKRRLRLYGEQHDLASKSLDLMLKSFSVSSSDLTGVLRIRQQVLDYELNSLRAAADLNTASAWIKRIMANTGY